MAKFQGVVPLFHGEVSRSRPALPWRSFKGAESTTDLLHELGLLVAGGEEGGNGGRGGSGLGRGGLGEGGGGGMEAGRGRGSGINSLDQAWTRFMVPGARPICCSSSVCLLRKLVGEERQRRGWGVGGSGGVGWGWGGGGAKKRSGFREL